MSQPAADRHLSVKWLSAYLDRELRDSEAAAAEAHLEACDDCRGRLAGLRGVVSSLRGLEQVAPSPALNQWVVHRISLEDDHPSLMERIEDHLTVFTRQSTTLFYFAMVLSLAAIVWLFAYGLEKRQNGTIPVIFRDLPVMLSGEVVAAERMVVAGRALSWNGRQWTEEGVAPEAAARTLAWGSPEADQLLAANLELADLFDLAQPVVVEVGGEVVRLRHES